MKNTAHLKIQNSRKTYRVQPNCNVGRDTTYPLTMKPQECTNEYHTGGDHY
jgi:hypothetical protein